MMKKLILVLFIMFSYTALPVGAQEVYYMPFIENLRLRQGPTRQSAVIRLLGKYEKMILIEKNKQEVIDHMLGTWLKVKTMDGEIGYCFDGYCVFADKNDSTEPRYEYNVEKMLPGLWQMDFMITDVPAWVIDLKKDSTYLSRVGDENGKVCRWRYEPDKNELLLVEDSKIISRIIIKHISYGYMVWEYPGTEESIAFAKWTTELHDAVECGNLSKVRFLVEHGFDVNTLTFNSYTALHMAVTLDGSHAYHKAAIVEYLLSQGADVAQETMYGQTPLGYVRGKFKKETTAFLLAYGSQINDTDGQGDTLLSRTLRWTSFSALTEKGFKADWEFILFLVDNGADIALKDYSGRSPLLPLVLEDVFLLEKITKRACNPCLENHYDLLMKAAWAGYHNTTRFLLDYGVAVNGKGEGFHSGKTALHEAAKGGNAEIVRLLIKRGAHLNIIDEKGDTPLHCAAAGYKHDQSGLVIAILVKAGADIDIKNREGRTPLHTATALNNGSEVKALLENQPMINSQDNKGNTPLHLAVMNVQHYSSWHPYHNVIRILLDYGALTTIKNNEGRSVLDIADELDDDTLKRLLSKEKIR
jgi:ankyrin repeat protein